ncbi:MAG: CsbD family protein [Sphingomonadaceae bacterium]|nr:CsbD family protein [Sphingomonadaceae bacterium]
MDSDRIEGAAKKVVGEIKEGFGKLVGDKKTEAEGKAEQAEGKAQNTWGSVKDTVRGDS